MKTNYIDKFFFVKDNVLLSARKLSPYFFPLNTKYDFRIVFLAELIMRFDTIEYIIIVFKGTKERLFIKGRIQSLFHWGGAVRLPC